MSVYFWLLIASVFVLIVSVASVGFLIYRNSKKEKKEFPFNLSDEDSGDAHEDFDYANADDIQEF